MNKEDMEYYTKMGKELGKQEVYREIIKMLQYEEVEVLFVDADSIVKFIALIEKKCI